MKSALRFIVPLAFLLLPALAAVQPGWQEIDVNKDGKTDHVAITYLADIAFNQQGQIVGWYVKQYRGSSFGGNYDRAPNLVRPGVSAPGTLSGFNPENADFAVGANGDLIARFTQGDTTVTYTIHPRLLTLDLEVKTPTPRTLTWSGIGGTDTPVTKWLGQGSTTPTNSGSGAARYVSWQTQPTKGYALVLIPRDITPISLNVQNGAGIAQIQIPAGGEDFKVYGGQNEMVRLHVERLLELPGLFTPDIWGRLSLGLLWVMETGHRYTGSWFLAIVFLTILVRLLLWPLMHQQYKSMAEIQRIQPLIEEINKKYKDNQEKRTEATMKLYQEHKVNPAAGCLPLFLQMPILFVLWKVISNYEFSQGFLWLPDLALPDPYYILPVLYVASMIASTWLSAHGNQTAIRQGIFINLIFIFLVLQFPSGVTIYWILSTLISLGQQVLINRSLAARPVAAK